MDNLTVCLPTRNRRDLVLRQVKRLSEQFLESTIFVAENSANKKVSDEIIGLGLENVECKWTGGCLSIYQNFDFCIDNVKTNNFVLIGDDDLFIDECFLSAATVSMRKNSELSLVYGFVNNYNLGEATPTFKKVSSTFAENHLVVRKGIQPIIDELPMPPILGTVFSHKIVDQLKMAHLNHESADTLTLLELCSKFTYGFIPVTSLLFGLHEGNDHKQYTVDRLFADLESFHRHMERLESNGVLTRSNLNSLMAMVLMHRIRNYPHLARSIVSFGKDRFSIRILSLIIIQTRRILARMKLKLAITSRLQGTAAVNPSVPTEK